MTVLLAPTSDPVPDWTIGHAAIAYQACTACASVWYFRRGFCPRCGGCSVESRIATGRGVVCAASEFVEFGGALVPRFMSDAISDTVSDTSHG